MKAKQIYVVRHGQASGNDPEATLTELGLLHAKRVASFLDEEIEENHVQIISSPYLRATQTASEISRILNKRGVTDPRLIERKLGEISELSEDEFWDKLKEQFEHNELSFPHGESNLDITHRVKNFLDDLNSQSEAPVIIVVTHQVTMTLLLQEFNKAIGYKECKAMTHPDVYLVERVQSGITVKHLWKVPVQTSAACIDKSCHNKYSPNPNP